MIIDCILDRKDSIRNNYSPEEFYRDVVAYGDVGENIARAMDSGTEEDVKAALCEYIIRNEYNPHICLYVCSQNWLE